MAFRFLPQETAEMEQILTENAYHAPPRRRCESIAEKFNNTRSKDGQKPVLWKQVWNWFQNRRHFMRTKGLIHEKGNTKITGGQCVEDSSNTAPNSQRSMEFEAKSARDGAWYDVESFCSYRKTATADHEVKIQFAGFGEDESEWVNARTGVRQRSLPCEALECIAVLPNDLILCFQEANEQALYFDADVLDVQRRRHDIRGCRCRFWVRYRHDGNEEVVPLRKICRRPETEYRLQAAQQAQSSLLSKGQALPTA